MGKRREPLRFVCRGCGKESETWNIGNKGIFCSKACRADYERKGREQPRRYKQAGYWMLQWTEPGGTRRRPKRRQQFEHRRVWENANGPIPPGFFIHHINGDKLDNRLENLQMLRKAAHMHLHCWKGGQQESERRYRQKPEVKARDAARQRARRAKKREMAK